MGSLPDSLISSLQWWFGIIAIVATAIGMVSAIGTLVIRQESSRRQSAKESERTARLTSAETAMEDAQKRLAATLEELKQTKEIAITVREKAADRILTEEQITRLTAHLTAATWKQATPIKIFIQDADAEAAAYATQLKVALENAGISKVFTQSNGGWLLPRGLTISTGNTAESIAIVSSLQASISAANIPITTSQQDTKSTTALLLLFVGSKP